MQVRVGRAVGIGFDTAHGIVCPGSRSAAARDRSGTSSPTQFPRSRAAPDHVFRAHRRRRTAAVRLTLVVPVSARRSTPSASRLRMRTFAAPSWPGARRLRRSGRTSWPSACSRTATADPRRSASPVSCACSRQPRSRRSRHPWAIASGASGSSWASCSLGAAAPARLGRGSRCWTIASSSSPPRPRSASARRSSGRPSSRCSHHSRARRAS